MTAKIQNHILHDCKHHPLFVASFWRRTCLHFSSTYYGRNPDGMCVFSFCKRSTSFSRTSVMRLLSVSKTPDKVQILIGCLCPDHLICFSFLDYLLSNNHVNSIIVHKFDFSDEEIMAYYISFLKTLSLKLNNHTVHFFYNEVRCIYLSNCHFSNDCLCTESRRGAFICEFTSCLADHFQEDLTVHSDFVKLCFLCVHPASAIMFFHFGQMLASCKFTTVLCGLEGDGNVSGLLCIGGSYWCTVNGCI